MQNDIYKIRKGGAQRAADFGDKRKEHKMKKLGFEVVEIARNTRGGYCIKYNGRELGNYPSAAHARRIAHLNTLAVRQRKEAIM